MRNLAGAGGTLCSFILVVSVAGCSSPGSSSGKPTSAPRSTATAPVIPGSLTVGFVTDAGHLHDRSFNDLTWAGLQQARVRYGITPLLKEPASEADYVHSITDMAKRADLTIAVGYGMGNAVYQVASSLPNKKFAIVDGRPLDAGNRPVPMKNVADILFKEQESGYLVGVIAGLMEKNRLGKATHNVIAYMGGQSIPQVDHYLAGYVAGARHVDPNVRILDAYSQTFTDAGQGKAIGLSQIGEGADILFQVAATAGVGYLAAAGQKGVYGIGVDANQSYLGTYVITSAVKRVDVAVEEVVRSLKSGQFLYGDRLFGMAQGATGFAPPSPAVPASIVAQANTYGRAIATGKIVPPTEIPAR